MCYEPIREMRQLAINVVTKEEAAAELLEIALGNTRGKGGKSDDCTEKSKI